MTMTAGEVSLLQSILIAASEGRELRFMRNKEDGVIVEIEKLMPGSPPTRWQLRRAFRLESVVNDTLGFARQINIMIGIFAEGPEGNEQRNSVR